MVHKKQGTDPTHKKQGTDPTDKVQHTHKGHDCASNVDNQALVSDCSAQQVTQNVPQM